MGFTSAYLCWLSFLVVCFLLLFIQVGYKIDACSGPSPPTPRHGGVPNPITAGGQSRKLGSNLINLIFRALFLRQRSQRTGKPASPPFVGHFANSGVTCA
jgi:hypothetical protein